MIRLARFTAPAFVLLIALAAAADGIAAPIAPATPMFKRGATLVEFFEFPKTIGDGAAKAYANPAYPHPLAALSLFDFDELQRLGFDHVRVPLDMGPLLEGDEAQREQILHDLVMLVADINGYGLAVLVTLLPPSLHHELPETNLDGLDGPKFSAYAAAVERVAGALAGSAAVALEPMNEPQSECRIRFGTDWTDYQRVLVERVRRISARLSLFLTGGCWSNIEGLASLGGDLVRDPRNFISVHFYYPFLFTHQSAGWSMPYLAGTIGVPYPASAGSLEATLELTRARFHTVPLADGINRADAEAQAENEIDEYFADAQGPAQIGGWMNRVAAWQKRENVPGDHIVFTEFGAMKQLIEGREIGRASRARWLRDASASMESHGWGWTVYVLRDDPFGIYARMSDRGADPDLLRALRLGPPAPAE